MKLSYKIIPLIFASVIPLLVSCVAGLFFGPVAQPTFVSTAYNTLPINVFLFALCYGVAIKYFFYETEFKERIKATSFILSCIIASGVCMLMWVGGISSNYFSIASALLAFLIGLSANMFLSANILPMGLLRLTLIGGFSSEVSFLLIYKLNIFSFFINNFEVNSFLQSGIYYFLIGLTLTYEIMQGIKMSKNSNINVLS